MPQSIKPQWGTVSKTQEINPVHLSQLPQWGTDSKPGKNLVLVHLSQLGQLIRVPVGFRTPGGRAPVGYAGQV